MVQQLEFGKLDYKHKKTRKVGFEFNEHKKPFWIKVSFNGF
jgi:hypothetical protein